MSKRVSTIDFILKRLVQKKVNPDAYLLPRQQWTREINGLMLIVITIASAIFGAATLTGYFALIESYPVFVSWLIVLSAWLLSRGRLWRAASFFPSIVCFLLGGYGSVYHGLGTSLVLFYALAIILASFLLGNNARRFVTAASIIFHMGMVYFSERGVIDSTHIASLLTFMFILIGISLLLWYFDSHLQRLLLAQNRSNMALEEEIALRQQVEDAHREQEAQLRRLAENTTDMVAEIDPNGIIRYASPSHKAGLGYDSEILVGKNAYSLIVLEDVPKARLAIQKSSESRQPVRVELRLHHADGHIVPIDISGTPLFNSDDTLLGHILSGRDITHQKQAARLLAESETKYRSIVESTPLGIHMYQLREDGALIFSGFNPAADKILGIDHTPLIGKTIEEAFPPLVHTDIPEAYRRVACCGEEWENEQVVYSDDRISGVYAVHAFQSSPGQTVVLFEDITEKMRAAEALRVSEEKFYKAFQTSPDSININRLADGVYIDINQGFTELTGYTREDSIGKSSLDLNIWVDPADRARLVEGLRQFGEVNNLQARFRRKNGEIGIGLMSATLMEVDHEQCILSITRDITERYNAEIALREAHLELERAYTETLKGWALALELRERETADHSHRVVELTKKVARAMGLDDGILLHIEHGALLHDIGKLGVPDNILLKPGALTNEEWNIMRQHPTYARDLLINIPYLEPSIPIPYSHHERWDGSGYPQGLAGQAIPLEARIFAVVDVYDALLSDRPYRPAWPEYEVLRYLKEQRGRQFDPQIVDLFLEIIAQL